MIVLGSNDEAGSVLIQPVDDARSPLSADAIQIGAVGQQGIDQRSPGMTQRWVDNHPGWFVHDDEIAILVADIQRYVLCLLYTSPSPRD